MLVVTGAASGIGRATALLASQRGIPLALVDRNAHALSETAEQCRSSVATLELVCDVADERDTKRVFDQAAESGVISAVFANAGVERNEPATTMPMATWQYVTQTNLTGTFLTCREALRHMERSGAGAIVCTSSPAALRGFPSGGNAAYAASKGGISAMVRALAVEYALAGIRINAIVPGAIDTPILLAEVPEEERVAEHARIVEAARTEIPQGRLGATDEVAGAVLWLLSQEASYVTGIELICDGGLMAASSNHF